MARRTIRYTLAALLCALPATAGHSADRVVAPVADAEFNAHFERFEALPPAPQPGAGAVDLAAIEPTLEEDLPGRSLGTGTASYYASKFHGRRTASGEAFDMNAMTAAHRTLPFGSKVRVTNTSNGQSVVVRINDRGPFHGNRVIDVSRAAAGELGLIARGSGKVELALIED